MKKISLVLGGGGAKGFAHIGAIQELKKNEIEFNEVIGTSIGALVGAFVASKNYQALDEFVKEINDLSFFKLQDFSFSKKGLLKGEKVKKYIEDKLGNLQFEDLEIKLKIVAGDLKNGKEYVFETGKISSAIRASISLPGIFQPVEYQNKILVDGGIVNPVPISLSTNSRCLAINLSENNLYYYSHNKSSLYNILLQSYSVIEKNFTSEKNEKYLRKNKNYLMISPKIKSSLFDFDPKDELIKAGRKVVQENIEKIKKLTKGSFF
jgi:NTE family protein